MRRSYLDFVAIRAGSLWTCCAFTRIVPAAARRATVFANCRFACNAPVCAGVAAAGAAGFPGAAGFTGAAGCGAGFNCVLICGSFTCGSFGGGLIVFVASDCGPA